MLPHVNSEELYKVLLTFDFVVRERGKHMISMSKRGLNRRVIFDLEMELDTSAVRKILAMARISEKQFILALRTLRSKK